MQACKKIDQAHAIFSDLKFDECGGCSRCCYMPWLLEEEYDPHLENFGASVEKINSIAFVMDRARCHYAQCERCTMYKVRPLDCRLFPLDIIEDEGKYW